jgi:hypothetical protein
LQSLRENDGSLRRARGLSCLATGATAAATLLAAAKAITKVMRGLQSIVVESIVRAVVGVYFFWSWGIVQEQCGPFIEIFPCIVG